MIMRTAGQTFAAAIIVGLLAAGWQLAAGSGAAAGGGATALETVHHDDD
jgi:hypothetical protein